MTSEATGYSVLIDGDWTVVRPEDASEYAWRITRDALCEPGSDPDDPETPLIHPSESEAETTGPRNAPRHLLARIGDDWDLTDLQVLEFKIYDDDDILYYEGLYVGPDDDSMFGPLWDFGRPNAGATDIHYKNRETGEWEVL